MESSNTQVFPFRERDDYTAPTSTSQELPIIHPLSISRTEPVTTANNAKPNSNTPSPNTEPTSPSPPSSITSNRILPIQRPPTSHGLLAIVDISQQNPNNVN
ncbi:plexin-B1 [Corchorus olitorius]|uniref:Plexin-B1 n=1 Tax=Corchorus olitorius TaxID=93759 RepID=A0A1R3HRA9_9ROSI|nr:plexin-B1 [Corchorus olitorius]